MHNRMTWTLSLTLALGVGGCGDDSSNTTDDGTTTSTDPTASGTDSPSTSDSPTTTGDSTSTSDSPTTTDPGTTTEGVDETTTIRVVHLSPDAPAVDIFANGDGSAPVVDGLPLKSSGTVTVPAGEYSFSIAADGSPIEEAVFEVPALQYEAGKVYTVVALGKLGDQSFDIIRIEDNLEAIDAATVRLQVTHAASGAAFAEVDVWAGGSIDALAELIPDFPFKGTGSADVPDSDLVVGLDVDNDQNQDAVWNIPGAALTPALGGLVHVFAFSDAQDVPSLQVVAVDGPAIQLDPS